MNPYEFGQRITNERNNLSISQKDLADILGVSPSQISNYESGKRMPSYDILETMANYFHVTTDYLLGISHESFLDISGLTEDQKAFLKLALKIMGK